ncbi:MAG: FAD-dependent oxidoreductase [Pseudomonadota bacterium]
MVRTYRSDAIVIGGGLAGICAALELLDGGKSVTLLDRDTEENFGGLARESFGGIFLVDTPEQRRSRINDSPQSALADWHAFARFGPDDHWPKAWAEAYIYRCKDDVSRWLRERGISFFPVPHWIERGLYTPGNSVPRFHMVWGTGRELALQLIRRLEAHPNRKRLTSHFGHRVDRLATRAGAVSGCDGNPIAGLYAAGEAAGFGGGMHGLRALEGSFLGGCILSGRIAGQAIAAGQ